MPRLLTSPEENICPAFLERAHTARKCLKNPIPMALKAAEICSSPAFPLALRQAFASFYYGAFTSQVSAVPMSIEVANLVSIHDLRHVALHVFPNSASYSLVVDSVRVLVHRPAGSGVTCAVSLPREHSRTSTNVEYVTFWSPSQIEEENLDLLFRAGYHYYEPVYSSGDDEDEDEDEDDSSAEDSCTMGAYHSSRTQITGWGSAESSALTIGVELECEAPDGNRAAILRRALPKIRRILGAENSVFAERDGSLNENGFELVFGWADMRDWVRVIPAVCRVLRNEGVISYDGEECGLHVNVAMPSCPAVSQLVYSLVSRDAEQGGHHLWRALAARMPNRYCAVGKLNEMSNRYLAVGPSVDLSNPRDSRRQKLYSIRMFKGTLNPARFIAAIQFAVSATAAACRYSQYITQLDWVALFESGFTSRYWQDYVLDHHDEYKELIAYMRAARTARKTRLFSDFALLRAEKRRNPIEAISRGPILSKISVNATDIIEA